MNKTAPRAGRNNHRAKPNLSFRAQNYKKNDEIRHKNYVFCTVCGEKWQNDNPVHTPRHASWGPSPALPKRALKKSPFFMTKTENAYDL